MRIIGAVLLAGLVAVCLPTSLVAQQIETADQDPTTPALDLADAVAGRAYSFQMNGSCLLPCSWSATGLPGGLSISSTGLISGVPTSVGADVSVKVRLSTLLLFDEKTFLLDVNPPLSITTSSPLPARAVGASSPIVLEGTGGTSPYQWSVVAGSTLPPGLNLSSGGVLSGTPTSGGTFSFTLQLADSSVPRQSAQKSFELTVTTIVAALAITTNSTLPSSVAGTAYSQTLSATGGTEPYSWSLTNQTQPPGLTLSSTGVLSGTPSSAGVFTFTVRVTDSATPQQSATRPFTMSIAQPLLITTSPTLNTGTIGTPYTTTLMASGGMSPLSWGVVSGQLPPGLTLSSSGTISGSPAAAGNYNFMARVTDNGSPPQQASSSFALSVQADLTITTASPLPAAVIGTPYQVQFQASATGPLTWSIVTGSLPAGISMSSAGLISGTPTASGTFDFTVRVQRNTPAQTAERTFQISVSPTQALTITTASVPNPIVNVPYSHQLEAMGGAPAYTWTVASGALPSGLTLTSSGLLQGTPTAAGSATAVIRVTDSTGNVNSRSFTIVVISPSGSFSLQGVPTAINPTQQIPIALTLASPALTTLSGTLTMSFSSNAAIATDDPVVQFSTGGRTVNFTIPANSSSAVFPAPLLILAGTVAGNIELAVRLQNDTTNVSVGSIAILPVAPQITNVAATRTDGGLEVRIAGYSSERRVLRIDFEFAITASGGIQRVNLLRTVESEFAAWYQDPNSRAFGSGFVLRQSFAVQGDSNAIESVTITLTNAHGATTSMPVRFTSN